MDSQLLRHFQREIEWQCQFIDIAAEDTMHALAQYEQIRKDIDPAFDALLDNEFLNFTNPQQALDIFLQGGDTLKELYTRFWYSIQAMLVAAASVSKLLNLDIARPPGIPADRRSAVRQSLDVDDSSPLASRVLRNHFEHFDERLERWWTNHSSEPGYGGMHMGSAVELATVLGSQAHDRRFDPATYTLTVAGDTYELGPVIEAARKLRDKAQRELHFRP